MKKLWTAAFAASLLFAATAGDLPAQGPLNPPVARYLLPNQQAQLYNWHGNYAYTPYGRTTALVVPPTANMQTNWNWGVGSSRICRINHQFTRNDGGPGSVGATSATPYWPQDTTQFGIYYVRGPWYPTQP